MLALRTHEFFGQSEIDDEDSVSVSASACILEKEAKVVVLENVLIYLFESASYETNILIILVFEFYFARILNIFGGNLLGNLTNVINFLDLNLLKTCRHSNISVNLLLISGLARISAFHKHFPTCTDTSHNILSYTPS